MDLFLRDVGAVSSDSFPIEISNPMRGCVGFILAYLLSVSYDPGNTVILHRCDHQGDHPCVSGHISKEERLMSIGLSLQLVFFTNLCGACGGLSGGNGAIDPEHIRGRREH